MFFDRVVAVALCAALAPTAPVFAQQRSHNPDTRTRVSLASAGPLQASIDRVRFDHRAADRDTRTATAELTQSSAPPSGQSGSVLGKVVMAGVLGFAGFLGGGYLGAKIEGPCDCDDPGFKGAIIGAPIGATVGAIAGWKLGGVLSR